jgi:invasion protein IalB
LSVAQVTVLTAEEDEALRYAYPSWSKFCSMGHYGIVSCFTRIDAFSACGIISVFVSRALAVALPPGAQRKQDILVTIDKEPSLSIPIVGCPSSACVASLDADGPLIARLKAGQSLAVQWLVSSNPPAQHTFPLAGFAEAHDGPELPMGEIKERTAEQLRELKMRREHAAEERRKRGGC